MKIFTLRKLVRFIPRFLKLVMITLGASLSIYFSLYLVGVPFSEFFEMIVSVYLVPSMVGLCFILISVFLFVMKRELDRKIDKDKLRQMLVHSMKWIWVLTRVRLLMLSLLGGIFYVLGKEFIAFIVAEKYGPAILVSFLLGMIFMRSIDIVAKLGNIFLERISWVFGNKSLLYKVPLNDQN